MEKPTYPRYLFIHVTPNRLWLARKADCRVVSLEPSDDEHSTAPQPTVIPDPIMAILQAGYDANGLALPKEVTKRARFQALQQVRFTGDSGFKDQLAKVINDDGDHTILVLMRMLGSERTLRVNAHDLEAA